MKSLWQFVRDHRVALVLATGYIAEHRMRLARRRQAAALVNLAHCLRDFATAARPARAPTADASVQLLQPIGSIFSTASRSNTWNIDTVLGGGGTFRAFVRVMYERGSITLFHFRDVPIRAHWTLLLILPYLATVLSVQFAAIATLAGVQHVHLVLPPLVWGAILALGLFASVALHEIAHTVVAVRFGGRVRSITLMLLGGVSNITRMPRRPRYEGLMALAGPVSSLAMGALLLVLHRMAAGPADLKMGLFYLGYMNVTLGVFNLVPAFPMDGGRILRAVLASRMGSSRATQLAAGVGRAAAIVMGIAGLWTGNFLLLMIAVFVYFGAGAEVVGERVREALDGLRIADLVPLIRRPPATISEDDPLSQVLPRMHEAGRLDLVVTDAEGAPVTIIQAADLTLLNAEERARLCVRDLLPRFGSRHVIVPWDKSANEVLERVAEERAPYVIVADPTMASAHGLVGLLAAGDIETMLKLRLVERPSLPPSSPPSRKTKQSPAVVGPHHTQTQVP